MGLNAVGSWSAGHTADPLALPLTDEAASVLNLTGYISVNLQLKGSAASTYTTISGTLAVATPSNGVVSVTFVAVDVAVADTYRLRLTVAFGESSMPLETDFLILP